ncbi:immunoglobulin E-set [Scheffersomyces xylosifermentans]|uniref:immunoglobulin E-set n=1 Tax=Scheffersomyces xylosifermentans TaxID=1304137 RepID=UPI00315CFB3B
MAKKTREELLADFENDLVRIDSMRLSISGHDEPLVYDRDMEDMPQRLHFILPENSTYRLTLKYKVKKQPLRNLTYKQVVTKGGIPVKSKKWPIKELSDVNIHDEEEHHEVTFPEDDIPGGLMFRGTHPATSVLYAEGQEVWKMDWLIEVVKKNRKPAKGGYD